MARLESWSPGWDHDILERSRWKLHNDIILRGENVMYSAFRICLVSWWTFIWKSQVEHPRVVRTEMLNLIHSSHLGIVKCKRRSKDVMYWPGMSKDIEKIVCEVCVQHSPSNPKEPLIPLQLPDKPWANLWVWESNIRGFSWSLLKMARSRKITRT